MFKNYLKIAFRNLWKNKRFSAINIFGLAIGLAICLLITLYVTDELSYDKYNEKAGRIYRVNADIRINGTEFNDRASPASLGPVLAKEYSQIEKTVRIMDDGKILVKKGTETLLEPNSCFADSTLFDVFTLPMIAGDPKTALTQPNSLVIAENTARKYFNSIDVIGKTLLLNNTTNYKITGVIKDMPVQSHFHFNFIRAMSEREDSRSTFWLSNSFDTYILTRPGTNEKTINNYLKEVTKKYAEPQLQEMAHSSFDDLAKKGDRYGYVTIPLTNIHLYSTITTEIEPSGNIQNIYIFIAIAVFILLIASVNFMNLSTARSAGRSKEVGVRKVLGSNRYSLIAQFLTESVLTSFVALVLALIIAELILPYFNQLSGKEIMLRLFSTSWLLPALLLTSIIVGLLAGLYPAFFLSAFEPIKVLKGKLASGFKGGWLSNSLVVFQFTAAIVLIVGTLIIYSQLNYIRNKKLGYNREQVLILKNIYALGTHSETFKNEVQSLQGVESITIAGSLPTSPVFNSNAFSKDAGFNASQSLVLQQWNVDANYIPTLGMEMKEGRNFSPQMPTDSQAVIINETAANMLGFGNPLNKKLYQPVSGSNSIETLNIIGVVKDFNSGSLRNKIGPVILTLSDNKNNMAIRIKTTNISSLIAQIENLYHGMDNNMAGQPFIYSFMDDDFNRLYSSEQRTGKIFVSFTFFAILIACLGLFGLVTYAAEQRTKEIGIRKVLGASISNIVSMLSKDFLRLVTIAMIIAFPVAWLGMNRWLQDFAYRTNISWWVFASAGVVALLIALITVSFQAIEAAIANPVKSLRTE
ncbi:MAG: cell division protein FtsX [Segetibacter sp.]|nr:cell division protein FtsX [Segetibacter sp.]